MVSLPRVEAALKLIQRTICECGCSGQPYRRANKRDVTNEPRVPAGQTGGGEWEANDGSGTLSGRPLLIPAQAITVPLPLPFELPLPPTEITPFPFAIPNGNLREPVPVNPYPDRPDCAAERADAYKLCTQKLKADEFKPGYHGFGKDFTRCVLGAVSARCGGNAT